MERYRKEIEESSMKVSSAGKEIGIPKRALEKKRGRSMRSGLGNTRCETGGDAGCRGAAILNAA